MTSHHFLFYCCFVLGIFLNPQILLAAFLKDDVPLPSPLLWSGPPSPIPPKLSDWNIYLKNAQDNEYETEDDKNEDHGNFSQTLWKLHPQAALYELNTPLFSDYAAKLRTVWIPPSKSVGFHQKKVLDFPEGTILTKTFYYSPKDLHFGQEHSRRHLFSSSGRIRSLNGQHVLETRILVKTQRGWIGLPYVWNEEQSEAYLQTIGQSFDVTYLPQNQNFSYHVPNMNQCKNCHVNIQQFQRTITPIGPTGENLHKIIDTHASSLSKQEQLLYLRKFFSFQSFPDDLTTIPRFPNWQHSEETIEKKARAYLAVNCAHCHNSYGPAKNSKLYLDFYNDNPIDYGVCKSPVAPGNSGAGLPFDIMPGSPEKSLLPYRMNSQSPEVMMPELGRSLIHKEGVELVSLWIKHMNGHCQ